MPRRPGAYPAVWAAALGRPGGSLLLNTTGYFVASQQYEIRGAIDYRQTDSQARVL
jgi:hypothetical protein